MTDLVQPPPMPLPDIAAADSDAAAGKYDLRMTLAKIIEHLQQMHQSALSEDWTADLRSSMQPLFCPKTKQMQRPSDICAAEIAVQLGELEKRVPAELKELLLKLSKKQRGKVVADIWQDTSEAQKKASKAVQLSVRLALDDKYEIYWRYCNNSDSEDEEDGEKSESDEESTESDEEHEVEVKDSEVESEDGLDLKCWITQRAIAMITMLDEHDNREEYDEYLSPKQFLLQAKDSTREDINESPISFDRVALIKQQLKGSTRLMKHFATPSQIIKWEYFSPLSDIDYYEHKNDETSSEMSEIIHLILRVIERFPNELLHELKELDLKHFATVIVFEWMENVANEAMNQVFWCSSGMLYALLKVCRVASILPEKVREVIKEAVNKHYDLIEQKLVDYELNRHNCSTYFAKFEELIFQYNSRSPTERRAAKELENKMLQYVSYNKLDAFVDIMIHDDYGAISFLFDFPDEKRSYEERKQHEKKKVIAERAKLIENFKILEKMTLYSSNMEPIQLEIEAKLHLYFENSSEKRVEKVMKMEISNISEDLYYDWINRAEKEQRKGKKMLKMSDSGMVKKRPPAKCSSLELITLLFLDVVVWDRMTTLTEDLKCLQICKSSDLADIDAANNNNYDLITKRDFKGADEKLEEGIEEKAAAIAQLGLAKLGPVLEYLEEPEAPEAIVVVSAKDNRELKYTNASVELKLPSPSIARKEELLSIV